MLRLGEERDEVAVVDDQRGSPTYVGHLAAATRQVLLLPYGVYHVAADGDATWADFAEAIFEEAGLDTRVRRITTAELGRRRRGPPIRCSGARRARPSCRIGAKGCARRYAIRRARRLIELRASYSFLTTWILDAPRGNVWDAIYEIEQWPAWWRGVGASTSSSTATVTGSGRSTGTSGGASSPIPCASRPDHEHRAAVPDRGEGRRRARRHRPLALLRGRETAVTYEWNVHTTRPWMNLLAPIARPVFRWNHNVVMHQGGQGLADLLGARLLAVT